MFEPKLNARIDKDELSPTLGINEAVQNLRAQGKNVYHMGFGQAPFPPHTKLQKALSDNAHSQEYLPTSGLKELKEAALRFHCAQLGLSVDDYECMVAPGSKILLYMIQMAVEGDLLLPVPSWVSYAPQADMLGDEVIPVETDLSNGFYICPLALRDTIEKARVAGKKPTKIILNSPNNPTGLMLSDVNLKGLAEVCKAENILIVSDEIYSLVDFDNQHKSIAAYAPNNTVITTGLSKYMSLGGWRVGVMLVPKAFKRLIQASNFIASEIWSCSSSPIQHACIKAYENDADIEKYVQECSDIHKGILRWVQSELTNAGVDCPYPTGAFYLFPNFDKYRSQLAEKGVHTSVQLAEYLIHNYQIATLPAVPFGLSENCLSLRLSGTDYDGAKVHQAYVSNDGIDESIIRSHCPSVYEGVQALKRMMKNLA